MSYITNQSVSLASGNQLDSYSRLRTSEVGTIFDSPMKYNDESLFWNTVINGAGTSVYNSLETILDLGVSGNGDSVIRQTKEYFQLQNGKSHQGFVGCVFGPNQADSTKKVGFYDNDDGFYIQNENGNIAIVLRTSISGSMTETVVPQANWNDPMDGTGPSGLTLDFTKSQVFAFDISFTGFGRVRIGALIKGQVQIFHEFENANVSSTNGFSTPSLPIRYELISSGGVASMKQQASCILIEGLKENRGVSRTVDTGVDAIEVEKNIPKPIIALRLKSQYRKAKIIPTTFSILHTSRTSALKYDVYLLADVTGGTWLSVGPDSIAEYNITASSASGGIRVASGVIPEKTTSAVFDTFENILSLNGNYDGTTDILVIVLTTLNRNIPAHATLTFKEVY